MGLADWQWNGISHSVLHNPAMSVMKLYLAALIENGKVILLGPNIIHVIKSIILNLTMIEIHIDVFL